MSFNPIDFLYYNPELQAYSNVITIEQAQTYYHTSNDSSNLIYDTTVIPSNLDPYVILTTNKDTLPISWLSSTIRIAMSNEGLESDEIATKAKFATTIFQPTTYSGNNVFTLSYYPNYGFDSNNLNIGDDIKILDGIQREYLFTVSNVSSYDFTVNPHKYSLIQTSNYVLDGIKVIDPMRIAKVSFVRNYIETNANQVDVLPESGTFNATLYKTLYPDAALLSDKSAYIDYIAKRKNNVLRVNNADDILANYVGTSNVKITGVNNHINRILTTGESNRLVTEFGIREYTETVIDEIKNLGVFTDVVITSNLNVSGPGNFDGQLNVNSNLKVANSFILTGAATMSNTLTVMKQAYFGSNIIVNNNALIYGAMSVANELNGPRFGIGYFMNSNNSNETSPSNNPILIEQLGSNTFINGFNIGIGTDIPEAKLHVVGDVLISSNLYVMNQFGIGLSNPTYQLQLSDDSASKPSSSTWTVSSDVRLKSNIKFANLNRCYDIVKSLPLKHYDWKDEYIPSSITSDRTKLGWIAQEVETVFPKAVKRADLYGIPDCRTLDTDQIYAAMYGCIQKLQNMVEGLVAENKAIKARIGMN